ncbi:MAG: hypothetical protein ACKO1U_00725 [Bacteroidota bacterium]
MSRVYSLLVFLSIQGAMPVFAQEDFTWWNDIHAWDGVTPWVSYMTVSPSYFGPNALPVPELRNGLIDSIGRAEADAGAFWSSGDETYDSRLRLSIPVARGKVTLESYVVPVEFYSMDTITRDVRAARDRDGKGRAGGDIHFSTQVAILKDRARWPDLEFEAAFRTASGTRLGAARYTDAPGYHFSVSGGRDLKQLKGGMTLRLYGCAGFYAFQTYDPRQLQNDCFLWGAGIDIRNRHWCLSNQLTGYAGHQSNGDRPMVFRSNLQLMGGKSDAIIRFQWGLQDFAYTSLHIGWIRNFDLK